MYVCVCVYVAVCVRESVCVCGVGVMPVICVRMCA